MRLNSILATLRSIPLSPRARFAARRAAFRPRLDDLDDRILPSFNPAVNYPVGDNPTEVKTADLNGDGKLDLATVNYNASTVSVQLGDGLGGFGPSIDYGVGSSPVSVAVGDFNNDTKLDLATANQGSWDVTVLLGNGNGTFQPAVVTNQLYEEPLSLAEGDFNEDGKMDLAVGLAHPYTYYGYYGGVYTSYYGEVGVLIGTGQGGFGLPEGWTYTGGLPYDLAVGDVNGDGNLDIASTNYDYYYGYYGVNVTYGNGTGGLFPTYFYYTSYYATSVAVGDVTGDGRADLITAGYSVDVLPGTGTTTLGPVVTTAGGPNWMADVATADFNGDGKLDVVTVDPTAGTVKAFLGAGDGSFNAPLDHAAGSSPWAVLVGKFNADGLPDVAAANAGSDNVSVLINDGKWPVVVPRITVGDVTVTEGNTGTVDANFKVSLSIPSPDTVTVTFTTSDGSASSSDYTGTTQTVTFAPGVTEQIVSVPVIGDRLPESSEYFLVTLNNATNGSIYDGQAVCTILDNEPRISINNVSQLEGNGKSTTTFVFTVTLSDAYDQAVTVNFATANGTATAGSDYQATSGTLTFAPGVTSQTITVTVNGDNKRESNEYFFVNLAGVSSNAFIDFSTGVGTIFNDDNH